MLGKLMKYEWKNTCKIFGMLLLFLALMTLLIGLSFQTPFWGGVFGGRETMPSLGILDWVGLLGILIYIIGVVAVAVGGVIYLGVHFYKTMYADEGYLTHTLPVNSRQLLAAKLLIGGFWYLMLTLALFLSAYLFVVAIMFSAMRGEDVTIREMFAAIFDVFRDVGEMLLWGDRFSGRLFLLLRFLISPFVTIMELFGAITLAQLSSRYRAMLSIVWYFGITLVISLLDNLVVTPITYSAMLRIPASGEASYSFVAGTYSATVSMGNLISFLVGLAVAVGLYFLSSYIITRKLNLE